MKIIIWSKNNCDFCTKAKKLLDDRELEYEERNIDENWSREQLKEILPNARKVPQIFIDQVYVGGYTELVNYKI